MKICYISEFAKPYSIGGVETILDQEARYMRDKGHELVLICFSSLNSRFKLNIEKDDIFNRRYIINRDPKIDLRNKIKKFLNLIYSYLNFRDLIMINTILKSENPDIIHLHYIRNLLLRRYLFSKDNIIYSSHDYSFICPRGGLLRRKGKICEKPHIVCLLWQWLSGIKRCKRIIAVSNFVKNMLIKYGINSHYVYSIPNFIDDDPLSYDGEKKISGDSKFILLYVGRLQKQKGVRLLVELIKMFKQEDKVELWIVGDGEEIENLQCAAGADSRIRFWGRIKKEKLSWFYNNANLLLLPSICPETFGLVIVEAMDHGLPVIAFRVGAVTELVENGKNGFIVDIGDIEGMKSKIDLLRSDVKLYELMSSLNYIRAKSFSKDNHCHMLEKIYHLVSASKKTR